MTEMKAWNFSFLPLLQTLLFSDYAHNISAQQNTHSCHTTYCLMHAFNYSFFKGISFLLVYTFFMFLHFFLFILSLQSYGMHGIRKVYVYISVKYDLLFIFVLSTIPTKFSFSVQEIFADILYVFLPQQHVNMLNFYINFDRFFKRKWKNFPKKAKKIENIWYFNCI